MQSTKQNKKLKWWQLSLLGVGCTIGTGFFLGTSIAIEKAGPAVLFLFLLAAIGTYIVYDGLSSMTVAHPEEGSFRSYSKKAFGRWAGFGNGWIYCLSEICIMGSQLIALGIFTQFWFPNISLWILTAIYSVLGLLVILTGLKGFEAFENVVGAVKFGFVVIVILVASVIIIKGYTDNSGVQSTGLLPFFSEGVHGTWVAFLYAFYAFGGIEIMGLVATDLEDPKKAPKAGRVMIISLTIVYMAAIASVFLIISWSSITPDESPFITALGSYQIPFVTDILNGVLIIAGFSTMVAALYAVITILTSLAKDHDAPKFLVKKKATKVPIPAFIFTAICLMISCMVALLLPNKIFLYIVTAAGLMLLYNWVFILLASLKLIEQNIYQKLKSMIGVLLIMLAIVGTLFVRDSRIGFFVSLFFICMIGIAILCMRRKWQERTDIT